MPRFSALHLSDIMDAPTFRRMREQGYVKRQVHPEDPRYWILNYTDAAVYDRCWNEVTLNSRGLIVFQESEAQEPVVIARPFRKFFNYGEPGAAQIGLDEPVNVADKVDGSLGILYTGPDGLPAIATRGSFASEQAIHATKVYRERYAGQWDPQAHMTYLFEIVYPGNRIVLDYGQQDDLVLIGMVFRDSAESVATWVAQAVDGWPGPVAKTFPYRTLTAALAAEPRKNAEGFVVTSLNTGEMLKIKQEDYLALHKIIFGLNEREVWGRLGVGDTTKEICDGLPDEFHEWVTAVSDRLTREAAEIRRQVEADYGSIVGDLGQMFSRKDFALKAREKENSGLLFMLLDGKQIDPKVWDLVRPGHVPFASAALSEGEAA